MSVEEKYAYRFGYLRSEKWQSVRLDTLVRESGKCQICGEESISNDAHHVWYPVNIYDTNSQHLVILCRDCHKLFHSLFPNSNTNDEDVGRKTWITFRNAMEIWILSRRPEVGAPQNIKQFREAHKKLRKKFDFLHSEYQRLLSQLRKNSS